jgi:hypothetical protein
MKEMKHIIAIVILGLSITGCAKQSEESPSTPPARVTLPNRELMLEISRKAIATRLPNMQFADLELRNLSYRWSMEDTNAYTNEQFNLDFRVIGSRRKEKEDGETVFKVDTVDVDIDLDGRIDKAGVGKGIQTFRSSSMKMRDCTSSQGGPVWGDPFYPIELTTPLPVPDRNNLTRIAFTAIRRFKPDVDTSSLELRSASFAEMHSPEDDLEHSGFWLTFWITNSVDVTENDREIKLNREEISVQIETNGQVRAKAVRRSPGSSTHYKHN